MQSHLSLYVSNLERSVDFYQAFFGIAPAKVKPKYAKFKLEDPQWVISLVENPALTQSGFGHVGIVVDDTQTVDNWMKAAEARGVSIALVEQGTLCCYAKQDKFWVKDPDGVQWEVYTFHEDSEWNDPQYSASQLPTALRAEVSDESISDKAGVCCAG